MAETAFHVLIVGGGIGGLCLAQGLRKYGISVAVYERDRSPDARLQGYRLNIEPHGSHALHACLPTELWDVLVATAGDPGPRMGVFDQQLRELMLEDEIGAVTDPVRSHHAVSRITLRHLLLAGLGDAVHFDKQFVRYELAESGGVTAFFRDGTSATGHLLVGADGARSSVRRQLLPEMGEIRVPAIGVGGKLPMTPQTLAWLPPSLQANKNMILPSKDFLFTAAFRRRRTASDLLAHTGPKLQALGLDAREILAQTDDDDYLMWALVARRDVLPPLPIEAAQLRNHVEARMAEWNPTLRRIVCESEPHTVQAFEFAAAVKPAPWTTCAVTLIGDALHFMPPVGGMGGNAALHDAELLCDTLRSVVKRDPLLPALHACEAAMLASGFEAVGASLLYTRLAISRIPLLRSIAKLFFRTCGAFEPLRRVVFSQPSPGSAHA